MSLSITNSRIKKGHNKMYEKDNNNKSKLNDERYRKKKMEK